MRVTMIYGLVAVLVSIAAGCGASVEDACDNLADQCGLNDTQRASCVDQGKQKEKDEGYQDGVLNCIAEAETCAAVQDCKASDDDEAE